MTLASDDFRSEVFRRTANGKSLFGPFAIDPLFRQTEVSKSDVSLAVQDDILWLQVSVDGAVLVHSIKGCYDLSGIESYFLLRKSFISSKMEEKFPAIKVVHYHV